MRYLNLKFFLGWVFAVLVFFTLTPIDVQAATFVSGPLTQNTTWQLSQSPIVVGEAFVVPVGITLTIKAGVIVKFDPNAVVRPLILGKIYAEGTSYKKIYFTSLKDDSVGGDTNEDGESSSPSNQDWRLDFGDTNPVNNNITSTFESVNITYMEVSNLNNRKLNISASSIKNSSNGFRLNTNAYLTASCLSTSEIANSVFVANGNSTVKVSGGSFNLSGANADAFIFFEDSNFELNSSTVSNNSSTQSVLDLFGSDGVINNSTLIDNQGQGILTFNDFTQTRPATLKVTFSTIKNMGREATISFDDSRVTMDTVSMLTLPLFGIGLFDSSASLKKVTLKDGGDSGIVMFDTSDFPFTSNLIGEDLTLDNFVFAGILSFDGQVQVTKSNAKNNDYGAYAFVGGRLPLDETFSFTESNIYNNSSFGIRMDPALPLYQVQATKNWWGAASGPFHPTLNCNGTGNAVSDGVEFSPFYTSMSHTGLATANSTGCPLAPIIPLGAQTSSTSNPSDRAQESKSRALGIKQQKLEMLHQLIDH